MNSGRRRILAVMVVTAALCADQARVAAPSSRGEAVEIASIPGQLVSRLARSLRNVVPSAALRVLNRDERRTAPTVDTLVVAQVVCAAANQPLMPFQFRLPPPAC